ncbi:hypothetical protein EV182_008682, partial [Spiromyces aspiralis]
VNSCLENGNLDIPLDICCSIVDGDRTWNVCVPSRPWGQTSAELLRDVIRSISRHFGDRVKDNMSGDAQHLKNVISRVYRLCQAVTTHCRDNLFVSDFLDMFIVWELFLDVFSETQDGNFA